MSGSHMRDPYGDDYGYGIPPTKQSSAISGRSGRNSLDSDPSRRVPNQPTSNKYGMNDPVRIGGTSSAYGNSPFSSGRSSAGPVRSNGMTSGYSMNEPPMYRSDAGRSTVNDPVRLSAGSGRSNTYNVNEPVRLSAGNGTRSSNNSSTVSRANQLSSGAYGSFSNNGRIGSGRR